MKRTPRPAPHRHAHSAEHGHTHTDTHTGTHADTHANDSQPRQRSTRQRNAIRQALTKEARPLSPPEVLLAAQKIVPRLGIATVYRNLKAMVDAGEITPVVLPGERCYYELASKGCQHHHHFSCDACGKIFDIDGCEETFARLLPEGFSLTAHELTLYGLCARCQSRQRA